MLCIWLNAMAYISTGLICSYVRRLKYGISDASFSFKSGIREIKKTFNVFVGDFAPNLYSNIPQLIIGTIVSPSVFASYAISMRLINVASSFQIMFSKAAYPLLIRGKLNFKTMISSSIAISLIPMIVIFTLGDILINIVFGGGYYIAYTYLSWLSVSLLFNAILCSFSYGYFLPMKKDNHFRNISLFVSFTSAIIGYWFISIYGAEGAIAMFIFARFLFSSSYACVYYLDSKSKAV
ncbi:hypothetical protein HUC17_19205 [Escherichia coli]|nr:hypothetical protein [Escherichia coli]